MPIERDPRERSIRAIVDPCVALCAFEIDLAVDANPQESANAIRMTVIDLLTASVISAVAKSNAAGMPISDIIERHVIHLKAMAETIERHNRGQQS